MKQENIKEIKLILDELGLDYRTRVLPNTIGSIHIAGQLIVRMYVLSNRLFGRNNQPTTCSSCLINIINDFIDYILINDVEVINEEIVAQNKEKGVKK